jgi:hypothetical protein
VRKTASSTGELACDKEGEDYDVRVILAMSINMSDLDFIRECESLIVSVQADECVSMQCFRNREICDIFLLTQFHRPLIIAIIQTLIHGPDFAVQDVYGHTRHLPIDAAFDEMAYLVCWSSSSVF